MIVKGRDRVVTRRIVQCQEREWLGNNRVIGYQNGFVWY